MTDEISNAHITHTFSEMYIEMYIEHFIHQNICILFVYYFCTFYSILFSCIAIFIIHWSKIGASI